MFFFSPPCEARENQQIANVQRANQHAGKQIWNQSVKIMSAFNWGNKRGKEKHKIWIWIFFIYFLDRLDETLWNCKEKNAEMASCGADKKDLKAPKPKNSFGLTNHWMWFEKIWGAHISSTFMKMTAGMKMEKKMSSELMTSELIKQDAIVLLGQNIHDMDICQETIPQ